jgi:hypothetical protein
MAVHNCGFSGLIMSTELIMLSIVLRNEDNATPMASPVYEHSLWCFQIKNNLEDVIWKVCMYIKYE